jgi:hypothetical protein
MSAFWRMRLIDVIQAAGVFLAVGGLVYTAIEVRNSRDATSAEIGLRFDDRFLQRDMVNIRDAVESNPPDPILKDHHGISTDDQLEQFLGYYDELYYLRKQGSINDLMMWDLFCSDIDDAYGDPEVTTYLREYRSGSPRSKADFMGFDHLAQICMSWDKNGYGKSLDE